MYHDKPFATYRALGDELVLSNGDTMNLNGGNSERPEWAIINYKQVVTLDTLADSGK